MAKLTILIITSVFQPVEDPVFQPMEGTCSAKYGDEL